MKNEYIYEQNRFQCFVAYRLGNFLHIHNEIEILYVYKGKIRAFCNFKEYVVNEHEFIMIFPNTIHAFEPIEETEYLLTIFKKENLPMFTSVFTNYQIEGVPIFAKKDLHEEVGNCLNQIYQRPELQIRQTNQATCNITMGYLLIMMEHILNYVKLTPIVADQDLGWIYKVLNYLNENFETQIKLEDISKTLGISKFHLSRTFNSRMGCSINEYVNRLRVNMAKRLIEETDLPVTHIALECGFDSLATFFRVFKILEIGSPKKYRDACLKKKVENSK